MMENATAYTKKGFSIVEFLITLIILTLTAVALLNVVVLLLHHRVKQTVKDRAAEAALNLIAHPEKIQSCQSGSACKHLLAYCENSISCKNDDICYDNNSCIVCSTNPHNGRHIFYGFNATEIEKNKTYSVTLCCIYGQENGTYTTVITLP